ncbi:MAG TPA: VOC family protein [Acidimicrobiia bacterium]|nr:VOC family protein [Acidimicrobiia bacterium]
MTITNAFASLAVRDLAAASPWYERLLGPGTRTLPMVIEWRLADGGGLQVYAGPERAGAGSCTFIVNDIDETAERLRTSGVIADPQVAHHDEVDTIMIKDPDGNSIAFAAPR